MKPVLEQIPTARQQSIYAFHFYKQNFETPWHFHPQNELTYIEESTGTRFIGDHVSAYEPGELVLLRSNLPHFWKNQFRNNGMSQSTVVQWNKDIYADVPELEGIATMLKTASRGIIYNMEDAQPIIPLLKRLPLLNGTNLYIELLALLQQLSGCRFQTLSQASFEDDLPSEYGSRMTAIHDFIENHYNRKIYLKELASLVNLSEQSFSRFFTKMMGRSFFTFLNEYRINMAIRLLIDTDRTVSEIGYACGFESLPFFHKQFNKYRKESPLKYRNRYARK